MEGDSSSALGALNTLGKLTATRAASTQHIAHLQQHIQQTQHIQQALHPGAIQPFTGVDWALLIALIVMLVITAAAAAAETALTSVSRIRIRNLAEDGDLAAQRIQRIISQPDIFLSTILVVNDVAVITASTLATIIAINLNFTGAEIISTVLLALVTLIFCEITPKTAAVQNPERWARWLIRPVAAMIVVLRPLVIALTAITSAILRLFGVENKRRGPFMTEEELRLMVEVGEEEGVLEEEEREMIHNVFDLADTSVREIMVPRIDMVTVEADDGVDTAVQLVIQGGQSRIPVYDDTINDIIGVLYAKDLLRVLASSGPRPAKVRQLMLRQAYFVPESKRLDDLLHEMQRQHVHIAIVVDEYGAVVGLVTIEDLVEEIIGDIQDEYDKEEQLVERVSADEYIVDAKISLDEFNELLDKEMVSDEYETLGGFVYTQLDKIPTVGDTVRYEDLTITVLATKGRRVTKVKVVREEPQTTEQNGDQSGTSSNHRTVESNGDQADHAGRTGRASGSSASSTPLGERQRPQSVS